MIKSLWKGFNFFTKKGFLKTFIAWLLLGVYSYFVLNFVSVIMEGIDFATIKLGNFTQFLISSLGINLLWFVLSIYGLLLLSILLLITVANNQSETQINFWNRLKKSINYSFLFLLVGIVFLIVIFLLASKMNILTIILITFVVIAGIFLMTMYYIGNVYLGLFDLTVREALEDARKFIRKKFWSILGFLILSSIVVSIIFYVIDLLYFIIFFYNPIASMISIGLTYFLSMVYIMNALTLFVKKNN